MATLAAAMAVPLALAQAPPRDASSIVRAVEARYQAAKSLKAVFLERFSENGKAIRAESGQLYLSRGGRMRWEYESPEQKLFLTDGKNAWFYVPMDRTVTRAKMKESDDWRTPLALLVGKAKFSRFCSRVEISSEKVARPGDVILRCSPKDKDYGFHELLVQVDTAARLTRVLIREAGGVETEFQFGQWLENPPLRPDFFQFKAPPGVAIVEADSLRDVGGRQE